MIKIDKGVPIPFHPGHGRRSPFPWEDMKPEDSFFAPGYCVAPTPGMLQLTTLAGRKYIPGSQWTMRSVVENGVAGVRVWRVS